MKKIIVLCLFAVSIALAGCSKEVVEEVKPESTQTPDVVETSTPMEGNTAPTPTPVVTSETEVKNEIIITDSSVSGIFVEETENSPTTIQFNEDGTFSSNVNACTGMISVKGTYRLDGDTVSLFIPEETGVHYLDNDQPFYYILTETSLTHKYDPIFSCADVDVYKPQ